MDERIVITGIGLITPIGNNLPQIRKSLIDKCSGVTSLEVKRIGKQFAGCCDYDRYQHQTKKQVRVGTQAGNMATHCSMDAILSSKLTKESLPSDRTGVFVGFTEHGSNQSSDAIEVVNDNDGDFRFWSHHQNAKIISNNPSGEVAITLGLKGPHFCIGGACAASNISMIQAINALKLGDIDLAIAGGVSEAPRGFGTFMSFKSQNALAQHDDPARASRPFDKDRNGIIISEGGAMYTIERLTSAIKRKANILCESVGYSITSDGSGYVHPEVDGQVRCMTGALTKAGLEPEQINILNTHATSTPAGDIVEAASINNIFNSKTHVNNTKSFVGHTMGAAGGIELAGNIPSFADNLIHPTINIDNLDPECDIPGLVINDALQVSQPVQYIMSNSFGMLGTNTSIIVKRYN